MTLLDGFVCLLIVCSLYLIYLVLEACFVPLSEATLIQDLKKIKKAFPVVKKDFTFDDVAVYYNKTTDRDYWLLELFVGPGLHTRLQAPAPIGIHGGHTRQPTIVLEQLHQVQASHVLEIGFGRGYCTFFLAGFQPKVHFKAIDLASRHVQVAQDMATKEGYTNVEFSQGNATALPDFGYKFDLIFGVESLCHLDTDVKVRSFIACAQASLRPKGRLVIVDGFRSHKFETSSEAQQQAMELSEWGFRIRRMPSKQLWMKEATRVGLTLVSDVDLTQSALPFWTLGWRIAHFVLRFQCLVRYMAKSSVARAQTAANLLSVATTAHALRDSGTAEYGYLVFENK